MVVLVLVSQLAKKKDGSGTDGCTIAWVLVSNLVVLFYLGALKTACLTDWVLAKVGKLFLWVLFD